MKRSFASVAAALTLCFAGSVLAAETTDNATASGASDSTVMTQTKDAKAQQKQKLQSATKGGRPINQTSSATTK
jgi:hypothetical protein